MGKDPGQSLSAGLVRMQAINTYVVQLPQHLHKDGCNHFPTEERSSAFDRQGISWDFFPFVYFATHVILVASCPVVMGSLAHLCAG